METNETRQNDGQVVVVIPIVPRVVPLPAMRHCVDCVILLLVRCFLLFV